MVLWRLFLLESPKIKLSAINCLIQASFCPCHNPSGEPVSNRKCLIRPSISTGTTTAPSITFILMVSAKSLFEKLTGVVEISLRETDRSRCGLYEVLSQHGSCGDKSEQDGDDGLFHIHFGNTGTGTCFTRSLPQPDGNSFEYQEQYDS